MEQTQLNEKKNQDQKRGIAKTRERSRQQETFTTLTDTAFDLISKGPLKVRIKKYNKIA